MNTSPQGEPSTETVPAKAASLDERRQNLARAAREFLTPPFGLTHHGVALQQLPDADSHYGHPYGTPDGQFQTRWPGIERAIRVQLVEALKTHGTQPILTDIETLWRADLETSVLPCVIPANPLFYIKFLSPAEQRQLELPGFESHQEMADVNARLWDRWLACEENKLPPVDGNLAIGEQHFGVSAVCNGTLLRIREMALHPEKFILDEPKS